MHPHGIGEILPAAIGRAFALQQAKAAAKASAKVDVEDKQRNRPNAEQMQREADAAKDQGSSKRKLWG